MLKLTVIEMQMGLIIDAKVLRVQRLFVSRPRTRPRRLSQGQDQDQDRYFDFYPRGASRPRLCPRGWHHGPMYYKRSRL